MAANTADGQTIYYEKICKHGHLFYSYGEGKVRREWVYEICQKAGLNSDDFVDGQWYEIPCLS